MHRMLEPENAQSPLAPARKSVAGLTGEWYTRIDDFWCRKCRKFLLCLRLGDTVESQSLPSRPPTRVLSRLSRNSGQRRRWLMNQLLTCVILMPVACGSLLLVVNIVFHIMLATYIREDCFLLFRRIRIGDILVVVSTLPYTGRLSCLVLPDRTMSS